MDNLVNIKPHIILQARMGSTRLPSKVMKLINGKPMIYYQIQRLYDAGFPIVLATSNNQTNDKLVEYVKGLGIKVFRGDENNVLERYFLAAKLDRVSDIIRITGDNPLIDGDFIKAQLVDFKPNTRRYYYSEGKNKKLPLGMSFEMFSFELLKEAYQKANSKSEKEHVTPYMHQNIPGDIEFFDFNTQLYFPDARLTVDTQKDFELITKLIIEYNCHLKKIEEIIEIMKTNEKLSLINNNVVQKKWTE